jgi:hypothetical protein
MKANRELKSRAKTPAEQAVLDAMAALRDGSLNWLATWEPHWGSEWPRPN